MKSVIERLMAKVVVESGGCWHWTGARSKLGYGNVSMGRRTDSPRTRPAHRVAYEILVGSIPAGMELDHLCRNPSCVNPAHLEPVTHRENIRRGARGAGRLRVTHCHRGHEYTPENTKILAGGNRRCRICFRALARDRYHVARKQAAA